MSKSTSNLAKQMLSINPDTLIELYEIDFGNLEENIRFLHDREDVNFGSGTVYRFCGMINGSNPIYWQNKAYQPLPIESEGFEKTGDGRLPRPKIRIANPDGLFSMITKTNKDFSNCKVIRKRTFARFLDQENYLNRNTNAEGLTSFGLPDPDAYFDDDIFYINKKTLEDYNVIEFELVSALELEEAFVPARIILSNYCNWTYRCSIGCGYKGLPLQTSDGQSLTSGFAKDKSSLDQGVIDYNKNFNDIKEWNRFGDGGSSDDLKGYKLGDMVKIVGKQSSNPYRTTPNIFVCIQSHQLAKDHYPFFDKEYWLKDECSKTLEACNLRYSQDPAITPFNKADKYPEGLRFGGFPGTDSFSVES